MSSTDCIVALTGLTGTTAAIASSTSLTAYVSCSPLTDSDLQVQAAKQCWSSGAQGTFAVNDGCGNSRSFTCVKVSQLAELSDVDPAETQTVGDPLAIGGLDARYVALVQASTDVPYLVSQVRSAAIVVPQEGVQYSPLLILGKNASSWDPSSVTYDNAPGELDAEAFVDSSDGYIATSSTSYRNDVFPDGAVIFDVTNDWSAFLAGSPNFGWYISGSEGLVSADPNIFLLVEIH